MMVLSHGPIFPALRVMTEWTEEERDSERREGKFILGEEENTKYVEWCPVGGFIFLLFLLHLLLHRHRAF